MFRQTARHLFILAAIVSVVLLAFATQAPAQSMQRVGGWPYGSTLAIDMDTDRGVLYVGSGGSVLIMDVSDPTNLQVLNDDIRTVGLVNDIFYDADDQHLYMAAEEGGLIIWDVQDLDAPAPISTTEVYYADVETPVSNVDIFENFAIVECSWGYVHSLDVSDPNNPQQISFNGAMGNPAHDLYVSPDGQAHTSGAQYYQRLEIMPDGSLNTSGSKDFIPEGPYTVWGDQNHAYIEYGGYLYIMSLSSFMFESVTNVGGVSDMVIEDGLAYIVNGDGFQIWDVSNPQNPNYVGSSTTTESPKRVVVSGHYAYIADGIYGLRIFDVADPSQPAEVGYFKSFSVAQEVAVHGSYVYLAESLDGLLVIDVSDMENAELVSQINTPDNAADIAIDDNYCYVADWMGGMRIYDITDPADPVEAGVYDAINIWRLDVEGDYAYVSDFSSTLHVVDISEPTSPSMVSSLAVDGFVYDVEVDDGFVYLGNYDNGLRIVDATDPANPEIAATYLVQDALDVKVIDDIAYLAAADWEGGFIILDVSDPTNPTEIVTHNPSGWFHPFDVAVSGDFALLGEPVSSTAHMRLFDTSNLYAPVELQESEVPGDLFSMAAAGPYFYLADGQSGLQIWENLLFPVGIDAPETEGRVDFSLAQNYPNPFAAHTTIRYQLPRRENVSLHIYDAAGRLVKTLEPGEQSAGSHEVHWNGRNAAGRL